MPVERSPPLPVVRSTGRLVQRGQYGSVTLRCGWRWGYRSGDRTCDSGRRRCGAAAEVAR